MGESGTEEFGCKRCWPESADKAWVARSTLEHVAELVDESHFHAMILNCPGCSQLFVSVFTETVDWVDGDDPQYWIVVPVSNAEAADLIRQGESLTEYSFNGFGYSRKSLHHDCPKGEEPRTYWRPGVAAVKNY